ncbi:MAG TPA: chloride channel protein, partial [Steroidobacteraceae bacterium]|nr:chloride channel protein [Steroidobacteraceae bacterium]
AMPWWGLGLCAAAGLVAGAQSSILTLLLYAAEDLFSKLPIHWMWWPALGGVVIGLGGLIEPHALGVGYDNIASLLNGDRIVQAVVLLLVVKALIWSIALGSGTSGGVLAPLLIMGGAIGSLFGGLMPASQSSLWALLGMAAMMGGTMRSPLTAIIFALELTHNVGALLPLAIGCTAAHATTVLLLRRSILTEKVARRGHHVTREYVVDPFETMRVADIMSHPAATLPDTMSIKDAVSFFTQQQAPVRHQSYPVVDQANRLRAIVTQADVLHWARAGWPAHQTLGKALGARGCVSGYSDELVGELADRMHETDARRVPVLQRGDGAVLGFVSRRDLLRVRIMTVRHERHRETLITFGK